jgi:hypothetical protein
MYRLPLTVLLMGLCVDRFFLKRAPFAVPVGELKVDAVRPAYEVGHRAPGWVTQAPLTG